MKNKPRVLIIAEAANPNWVSVPLVGWSLTNAIREKADAHLITHIRNRNAIKSIGLNECVDFTVIDTERIARPLWKLSNFLRGHTGKAWTINTAISTVSYYYFEYLVWQKFGDDIREGRYDVVHRITPLSPTTPSLIAKKCHNSGVPFVLGPLNGGVPWPKEFRSEQMQEREWLSYFRDAYKLLPGYRSTLRYCAALIIGSKSTLAQISEKHRKKCVYLPENAIDTKRFFRRAKPFNGGRLRVCFVGRLVPYKGPDMLIEAVAPLVRDGKLSLDILGDGPLLPFLKKIVEREQLSEWINFHGWVKHEKLQEAMCKTQVFAFPSVREFGGGVVLEAMALGIVPVIIDYAGPTELVPKEIGFKVPLGKREDVIQGVRCILNEIASSPEKIEGRSDAARAHVFKNYTWEIKAGRILEIYNRVTDKKH